MDLGSELLWPAGGSGDGNPANKRFYELASLWKNTRNSPTYYTDRGKKGAQVTRVGDTALEAASPSPLSFASARPIVLNRPFKSVAELAYAFRDLPGKSLNFSQDVENDDPQKLTADAALLDLFSMSESPIRAGVVNLNAASESTLTALLAGPDLNPMPGAKAALTSEEAAQLARIFGTTLDRAAIPSTLSAPPRTSRN